MYIYIVYTINLNIYITCYIYKLKNDWKNSLGLKLYLPHRTLLQNFLSVGIQLIKAELICCSSTDLFLNNIHRFIFYDSIYSVNKPR